MTPTRTMSLTFDIPPANLVGKPEAATAFMMDEMAAIRSSYQAGVNNGTLVPPTDLTARAVWVSDYIMQQLVERNPWIQYAAKPR